MFKRAKMLILREVEGGGGRGKGRGVVEAKKRAVKKTERFGT